MKIEVHGCMFISGAWLDQWQHYLVGDKSVDSNAEMGKQYRTRDGLPVRLYAVDCGGDFSVHGAVGLVGETVTWVPRQWTSRGFSDHSEADNLVEIPPEPTWLPFTPEELPRIVGRHVRRKANPGESMIVTWAKTTGFVVAGQFSVCREALLRDWQFLDFDADGKEVVTPCGVVVEATP